MTNLLDPAILFFVFGLMAGLIQSNLEIPPAISRFLSLYLLMALGLKGGFALSHSGLSGEVLTSLAAALVLALVVPLLGYGLLRRFVSGFDAAAMAATYGSVSAVTFVTAVQFLDHQGLSYGGHMAAAMALMEAPAILMAVMWANQLRRRAAVASGSVPNSPVSMPKILHEAFTDGASLLLLGAIVVGLISGDAGQAAMKPFSADLFKGMLAFFLLDMGLMAARNMPKFSTLPPALVVYALIAPMVHAALALLLALALALNVGDGALLMVLAASASYIAVPAVLRYALPEANASLYFGLNLGLTFPLNLVLGIPTYTALAQAFLSAP